MNKKLIYASVLALSVGLAGCSSQSNQTNTNEINYLKNQVTSLTKENKDLQKSLKDKAEKPAQQTTQTTDSVATTIQQTEGLGFTVEELKNRLNKLGENFASTGDLESTGEAGKIMSWKSVDEGMAITGHYDSSTNIVLDYGFLGINNSTSEEGKQVAQTTLDELVAASTTNMTVDQGKAIVNQLTDQFSANGSKNPVEVVKGNVKYQMQYDANFNADTLTISHT